jgi:hypothetical protein
MFFGIISFFFCSTEYKVTSIDQIKEKAVIDAFLRMYKILYQCGKVRAYIFRQNTQLPDKTWIPQIAQQQQKVNFSIN